MFSTHPSPSEHLVLFSYWNTSSFHQANFLYVWTEKGLRVARFVWRNISWPHSSTCEEWGGKAPSELLFVSPPLDNRLRCFCVSPMKWSPWIMRWERALRLSVWLKAARADKIRVSVAEQEDALTPRVKQQAGWMWSGLDGAGETITIMCQGPILVGFQKNALQENEDREAESVASLKGKSSSFLLQVCKAWKAQNSVFLKTVLPLLWKKKRKTPDATECQLSPESQLLWDDDFYTNDTEQDLLSQVLRRAD